MAIRPRLLAQLAHTTAAQTNKQTKTEGRGRGLVIEKTNARSLSYQTTTEATTKYCRGNKGNQGAS